MSSISSPHDLAWYSDPDYTDDGRLLPLEAPQTCFPDLSRLTAKQRYKAYLDYCLESGWFKPLKFGEFLSECHVEHHPAPRKSLIFLARCSDAIEVSA